MLFLQSFCVQRENYVYEIFYVSSGKGTEMEQVVRTHRTSRRSGLPRGVGELNPRPHSWIFTFVSVDSSLRSYLYTSGTVHTCSHCTDQSETTNLSDKWRSFFEIGATQFRSVTEITPKSPFLCMERSPTRCCFHTGAKATCYSVTSWRQWYG